MPQYPTMKTAICLLLTVAAALCPAQKRLVLIDQDGSGPGGSNQMAMLALLQAPQVEVLGITMVTGNAWRDEETLHTLRMLELTGHANVPVAQGAVFPLVRTQKETQLAEAVNGKVTWLGAWGQGPTMLVETAKGVTPVTPAHLKLTARIKFRRCPRAADAEADRRRRGALPHPPGSCASAPGHDLCRWPDDKYCSRGVD